MPTYRLYFKRTDHTSLTVEAEDLDAAYALADNAIWDRALVPDDHYNDWECTDAEQIS